MHAEATLAAPFDPRAWYVPLLACSTCRMALTVDGNEVTCRACRTRMGPNRDGVLDLMPALPNTGSWVERQKAMERSYAALVRDSRHLVRAYENDFGGQAELLSSIRGPVLDIGGGNGLIRDFLPAGIEYVSLEPSRCWFSPEWAAVAERFCSLRTRPVVRGIAERVPFLDGSFETVLAYWSLNHVSSPQVVCAEMQRVLRPGGRLIACLEDMEPTWIDVATQRYPVRTSRWTLAWRKVVARIRPWPVQRDHVAFTERDLVEWMKPGLAVECRTWFGTYLTLACRRVAESQRQGGPS
jgi:SAM-dependent methyltransferase